MKENTKKNKKWIWIAIILFSISAIMLYKGYDKMTNYSSPSYHDYSDIGLDSLSGYSGGKNAYVGGDSYNYIINAGYACGFYILSTMFCLSGFSCINIYYICGVKSNEDKEKEIVDEALKF